MKTSKKLPFSIIIPSYQDGHFLLKNIKPLLHHPLCEVIVVEAGGATKLPPSCRRVKSPQANRSIQMNLGAQQAKGEILLFLHADTSLAPQSLEELYQVLQKHPKYLGGCYRFALDHDSLWARVMEFGVLLREIFFRLPFGDQALFVRRKVFEQLGGYPEVPILEDVLLVRLLQQQGRLLYFESKAYTSARKWEQRGPWQTMLLNWWTMFQWKRGMSLETLAQARQNWFRDE